MPRIETSCRVGVEGETPGRELGQVIANDLTFEHFSSFGRPGYGAARSRRTLLIDWLCRVAVTTTFAETLAIADAIASAVAADGEAGADQRQRRGGQQQRSAAAAKRDFQPS